MVYFKVLLNDKRAKADNIYPVVIRVTHNRKNTTFSTGVRIKTNQWDDSAHCVKAGTPNAQAINKSITDFYSRLQSFAYQLTNEGLFSFDLLSQRLHAVSSSTSSTSVQTFKEYADQLVEDMLSVNRTGNALVYRTSINRLLDYVGNDKLRFTEIDYNLLEGFKRKLIRDGIKQNSISNYFRTLRAIYNKAVKSKLVDRGLYPFLDVPIKTERTAKRAIM